MIASRIMENLIDKRYRELVFEYYMKGATLVGTPDFPKWVGPCPFNPHLGQSPLNDHEKCAELIWVPTENSWKFSCGNAGSKRCFYAMAFPIFLRNLNPEFGRRYLADRYGMTCAGKGRNARNGAPLKGDGRTQRSRSRTKPQNRRPQGPSQSNPEGGQIEDRPQI